MNGAPSPGRRRASPSSPRIDVGLETTSRIPAASSTVWRLLTDTQQWPRWGPSVRSVDCAERFIGPGSSGRVQTAVGLWLPFRITDFEQDAAWSWIVAGIPATGHRVRAIDPQNCRLTFTVPAWAPFYLPVCAAAIRRIGQLALRAGSRGGPD